MQIVAPKLPQSQRLVGLLHNARDRYLARLDRFARKLITYLDLRFDSLIARWIAVIALLAVAKLLVAPATPHSMADFAAMALPFLLVTLAPVAGYRLATAAFPRGVLTAQPDLRLCRFGQWRSLNVVDARGNPAFGPWGFLASLIFGILMNVPFRSLEYLAGLPAIGAHAPQWAHVVQWSMTADVVVMNFLYTVCFVMGLRCVPLFPRLMVFAWGMDIMMQLMVAQQVSAAPHVPPAVADAMANLVDGNIRKVLISAAIWLPYLILSERVNVTFRHRSRAA